MYIIILFTLQKINISLLAHANEINIKQINENKRIIKNLSNGPQIAQLYSFLNIKKG